MRGEGSAFNTAYVFEQIAHFCPVLVRQAVARGVGDVEHGRACLDGDFEHPGQELVVGAAGVFGVKFHVLDEGFGQFDRSGGDGCRISSGVVCNL